MSKYGPHKKFISQHGKRSNKVTIRLSDVSMDKLHRLQNEFSFERSQSDVIEAAIDVHFRQSREFIEWYNSQTTMKRRRNNGKYIKAIR